MAADALRPTDAVDRFRLDVLATALVCLPIAWAAVRAVAGDWVPIGDDAYFTLRSLDVATERHPLLGAWSSGSVDTGRSVNNLGPIQLDLLIPFTRVAPRAGTAIGVAVVNVAAIVTAAWMLGRIGGRLVVVAAMVPIGLLCWTVGSEMLITPRQHQFLLLTYLCLLVATWAATAGDRWAVIPLVATASLAAQTHLSYPLLVGPLVVVAVVGQVLARRRAETPARFDRPWTIAVVLVLALWAQTLVDQFFGWGNLGDVVLASSEPATPGWRRSLELVGHGLLDPDNAIRRGFADYRPDMSDGETVAAVGLVAMVAALVAVLVWGWRSRRPVATAGAAVATTAVLAAVVDAARLPETAFGLTAGNYRWLWPTATFLAVGVVTAAVRYLPPRFVDRVAIALMVPLVLITLASLPRSVQDPDPVRYVRGQEMVAEAMTQIGGLALVGGSTGTPIVIDESHMPFGHPFTYPVALALAERGTEFRFTDPVYGRRFGNARVADGSEQLAFVMWSGPDALARRDDPSTVVWVDGVEPFAITLEAR